MNKQALRILVVASAMALATVSAQAAGTASAPSAPAYGSAYVPGGMGPWMMGGYGPAAGYGRGPGRGYGPGAAGGSGGWGMGPWMMGGYGGWGGYGPGMMTGFGGWGMGPWMMGSGFGGWGGAYGGIHLSDAQIQKIDAIEKAQFDKQWPLMRDMQQTMFGAWAVNNASGLDVDAVMKRATALSNLRLQMLRNRLEAQKQIDAVLTKDQRERLGLTP